MKLCMIGCGQHAWSSHGPAQARYAAEHPEVRLVACSDLDLGKAERYAERFAFARPYADALAMLAAEKPDVVSLVVPESATANLAAAVLERGLPVLIEKPPGRTVAEVDRLIASSERSGGAPVPHQVALNRRYAPLVRELRRRLEALAEAAPVEHVHYEMTRVDRRDPDFSVTAIHGIDAVRAIAANDFVEARFRYQEHPKLGPGVANIFIDGILASGATAHLAFCPTAGVVVERATVHTNGHTFFLRVPMWDAFDAPGRLEHLENGRLAANLTGERVSDGRSSWEHGGFFAEYGAFLGDLAAGRTPTPGLRQARQSVAIAEAIRERRSEYRA